MLVLAQLESLIQRRHELQRKLKTGVCQWIDLPPAASRGATHTAVAPPHRAHPCSAPFAALQTLMLLTRANRQARLRWRLQKESWDRVLWRRWPLDTESRPARSAIQ